MSTDSYILGVIEGSDRGLVARILRPLLAALALVYTAGLKLYLLPYRLRLRSQARLSCPVISIGNLTVGGTGKTPMTQTVCRILVKQGLKVCILSRGYRGTNERGAAVVSSETSVLLSPEQAGDEAQLLASRLPGVPVLVGKDRRVTGRMAIERFQPDVIVLDDGMQFYQLHRDMDIVLIDAQRPFDNGWTFPRGLLREPPSHLRRAGCIVITNADKAETESVDRLRAEILRLAAGVPCFTARYAPSGLRAQDGSQSLPIGWLNERKVAVLAAIANPDSFYRQVEVLGSHIVHRAAYPDHYALSAGNLQTFIESACSRDAEAVIVTEKDSVKLPPVMRPIPFYALAAAMEVEDSEAFSQVLRRAAGK